MKIFSVLGLAVALTACGGGGGGGSGGSTPTLATFPSPNTYAGTWKLACSINSQTILTIASSGGQLTLSSVILWYDLKGCTGPLLATETYSVPITATFTTTATLSVALPPSTTPTTFQADLIAISQPQGFYTVTGAGVYDKVTTDAYKRCFSSSGGEICVNDASLQPARSATNLALYASGAQLTILTSTAGVFAASEPATKQ